MFKPMNFLNDLCSHRLHNKYPYLLERICIQEDFSPKAKKMKNTSSEVEIFRSIPYHKGYLDNEVQSPGI